MSSKVLFNRFKNSDFYRVFNFKDEKARGRSLVMGHVLSSGIGTTLTSGVFYTSFLTMNGINIVDAGILTFIPYIAQLLFIFSPRLLQWFPRRRWILFPLRILYHLLFILGITVMPSFVHDPDARMNWFVGLVFAAYIVNSLGGTGYVEWHANFIPEDVRASYFSYSATISNFCGSAVAILSSIIADSLADSPHAGTVIVVLRYVGLTFALMDTLILLLPKEYPYPVSTPPKISNLFILPFKQKKFLLTVGFCFLFQLFSSLPTGVLDYHLINTVKVSYSYIYAINISWCLFLMALTPMWRKLLRRKGHVHTFIIAVLMDVPALLLYAFVNHGNYLVVMTIVRLIQHVTSVGSTVSYSNFVYMNMPSEDRSNYFTFHSLGISFSSFLGISIGTWFVSVMGDSVLSVFGHSLTAVPLLLLVRSVANILMALLLLKLASQIMPDVDRRMLGKK